MYYYVMENRGEIQYGISDTPPEIDYQMLTEEEFNKIMESLWGNEDE